MTKENSRSAKTGCPQENQPNMNETENKTVPGDGQTKRPKRELVDLLQSADFQRQLAIALPKHMTAQRFARIVVTQTLKNPTLASCEPASVLRCVLELAAVGIEPDGRRAHLIPRWNKDLKRHVCTYIVDYKGLVDLVRRSGEVSYIHADVICDNDRFGFSYGTRAELLHEPTLGIRGSVKGAYSFVRMKDGSEDFVVMGLPELQAIRERSQSRNKNGEITGPWLTDENEMFKKTVFRNQSKWLPFSSDLRERIEKDDDENPLDHAKQAKVVEPPKLFNRAQVTKAEEPAQTSDPEPENPIAHLRAKMKFDNVTDEELLKVAELAHCKVGSVEEFTPYFTAQLIEFWPDALKQIEEMRKEANP
jgi:recombination protein RecT